MSVQIFKTRTGSMKGDVYPFWIVPTTRASCIVPKRWVFLCFLGTRVERMVFTQKEILKTTVRCNTIEVENGLTSMWFYWISKPTILKLWLKKSTCARNRSTAAGFLAIRTWRNTSSIAMATYANIVYDPAMILSQILKRSWKVFKIPIYSKSISQ